MEHHISIGDALRFGWQKTRAHSMLIFQVLLTLFAVQVAQSIVSKTIGDTLQGGLATLVLIVIGIALGIGFTNIGLKIAKGEHTGYRDIMPSLSLGISYIAASLLAGLVTIVPIVIALIISLVLVTILHGVAVAVVMVPVIAVGAVFAIYFGLRYFFVRFIILENPKEITDSLRISAKITEGRKWWLLGFMIVLGLLNILGAILLLVGLLITIPMTLIAYAHVYHTLRTHHS